VQACLSAIVEAIARIDHSFGERARALRDGGVEALVSGRLLVVRLVAPLGDGPPWCYEVSWLGKPYARHLEALGALYIGFVHLLADPATLAKSYGPATFLHAPATTVFIEAGRLAERVGARRTVCLHPRPGGRLRLWDLARPPTGLDIVLVRGYDYTIPPTTCRGGVAVAADDVEEVVEGLRLPSLLKCLRYGAIGAPVTVETRGRLVEALRELARSSDELRSTLVVLGSLTPVDVETAIRLLEATPR
jgi:hypothetical protein